MIFGNILKIFDRLFGNRFYVRGATAAINDTTATDVITAAAAAAVNTGTNPTIYLTDVWVTNTHASSLQQVNLRNGTTVFLTVPVGANSVVHVKPSKPIKLDAAAKFSVAPLASVTSTYVTAQGFVTSDEDARAPQ